MFKRRTQNVIRAIHLRLAWLLAVVFGCMPASNFDAHAALQESDWKASFIVLCAKNFTWPKSRESEKRFLIGIIGNDEVRSRVDSAISGTKIAGKTVHVIAAAATDVPNCHIVYVASTKVSGALSQAKGNAVLTIGEMSDGFMTWFTTAPDGSLTAKGNLSLIQKESLLCTAKIGNVLFK